MSPGLEVQSRQLFGCEPVGSADGETDGSGPNRKHGIAEGCVWFHSGTPDSSRMASYIQPYRATSLASASQPLIVGPGSRLRLL